MIKLAQRRNSLPDSQAHTLNDSQVGKATKVRSRITKSGSPKRLKSGSPKRLKAGSKSD